MPYSHRTMKKRIFALISLVAVVGGALACCASATASSAQDKSAMRAQQSAERTREEWKRMNEALG